MNEVIGKVWVFGKSIDTDLIVPGLYLDAPLDEVIKHVFESIRPDFAKQVQKGDILIAGRNFGCGSSRENAPAALQKLGIGCIAAESFGRIFFRNAIAIGLPPLICKGVSSIFKDGDEAHVFINEASIKNASTDSMLLGEALSPEILEILQGGGMLEMLKVQRRSG